MATLGNALQSLSRLSPDLQNRMKAVAAEVNYATTKGFLQCDSLKNDSSACEKVELWSMIEGKVRSMISFRLYFINALRKDPGPPYKKAYEEYTLDDDVALEAFVFVAEEIRSMKSFTDFLAVFEKHCARCHSVYEETDNWPGSCQIVHVFSSEVERDYIYYKAGDKCEVYPSACCGSKVTVTICEYGDEEEIFSNRPCFTGKHTVNPAEVAYNGLNICKCTELRGTECGTEQYIFDGEAKFYGVQWI